MTEHTTRKIAKHYQASIGLCKKPVGGKKASRSRLNKKHHKAWRIVELISQREATHD